MISDAIFNIGVRVAYTSFPGFAAVLLRQSFLSCGLLVLIFPSLPQRTDIREKGFRDLDDVVTSVATCCSETGDERPGRLSIPLAPRKMREIELESACLGNRWRFSSCDIPYADIQIRRDGTCGNLTDSGYCGQKAHVITDIVLVGVNQCNGSSHGPWQRNTYCELVLEYRPWDCVVRELGPPSSREDSLDVRFIPIIGGSISSTS